MDSSHERALTAALVLLALLSGCSVGSGEGQLTGRVNAPSCDLNMADYALTPTFFGADPFEEMMEMRIQEGSDLETFSDGLTVLVLDAARVRADLLGVPIELTGESDALVQMNFYLNATCPPGRSDTPVNYQAVSGTIIFQNMYAPRLTEDDVETSARFDDVLFVDPGHPELRNAVLSGHFRFLHSRGRPAQRFP